MEQINFEELDRLSNEIAGWNQYTFPNATLESQMIKLEEEVEEFDLEACSPFAEYEELVDIFIVASALYYRFSSHLGLHILDYIKNKIKYNKHFIHSVKQKMEINKSRNWKEVDTGIYHH